MHDVPQNRLDRALSQLEETLHGRALAALKRLRSAIAERQTLDSTEEQHIIDEIKGIENQGYHVVERRIDTLTLKVKKGHDR